MNKDRAKAVKARRGQPRLSHETDANAACASFSELLELDEIALERWVRRLGAKHREWLFRHWSFWARPDQLLPPGDWVYWLILAGRGAGKTRAGAEAVREWTMTHEFVNLIGATADDAWGVLACCEDHERPSVSRSAARLSWPSGATSLVFSAEEPDRLRGKQHEKLWCDELAAWRRPEAFEQALLGLRLGQSPQAVITTTPRPIKIIKQLLGDANAIVTRGTTYDNSAHLAPTFLERIAARYEGRAIGERLLKYLGRENAHLIAEHIESLRSMAVSLSHAK
jgi:phage terminase large subunit-like protein